MHNPSLECLPQPTSAKSRPPWMESMLPSKPRGCSELVINPVSRGTWSKKLPGRSLDVPVLITVCLKKKDHSPRAPMDVSLYM